MLLETHNSRYEIGGAISERGQSQDRPESAYQREQAEYRHPESGLPECQAARVA